MGQGAPDLSGYAKTDDLTDYAKTTDLSNYVKATSLEDYAKRTALNEYIKTVDIPSNVPLQDNMRKVIGGDNNFQAAVRNLLLADPTFNTSITKFISDNADKFRGQAGITQFGALTAAQKAEVITGLYNANKISLVDELTGRDNFRTDIVNALAKIESIRGARGETGTMGPIGVSVQSASLSGDNLSFTMSNQNSLGPFNIRGPKGDRGETGPAGKDGSDYKDNNAANWFKERVMWCADGNVCNIPDNKNVGIGTKTPLQKLHVNGNITLPDTYGIQFNSGSGSGSGMGNYSIHASGNTLPTNNLAIRLVGADDGAYQRYFEMGHYTDNDTTKKWNPKFSVNSYNGDVNISGKLSVNNSEIKPVRERLIEMCPYDQEALGMINKTNGATYHDYLFSACRGSGTCDSFKPDHITERLLRKTEHCGAWDLSSVGLSWDPSNKKWRIKPYREQPAEEQSKFDKKTVKQILIERCPYNPQAGGAINPTNGASYGEYLFSACNTDSNEKCQKPARYADEVSYAIIHNGAHCGAWDIESHTWDNNTKKWVKK